MERKNLEILLKKFKLFVETINKKHDEFEVILQRYNYFKLKIQITQSNDHYIDCTFPYKEAVSEISSKDFCSCYYIEQFYENLCQEIVNLIGLEYIINF